MTPKMRTAIKAAMAAPHNAAAATTPAHLTPSARELLLALAGNSCAWRGRGCWSPKGHAKSYKLNSGEALIRRDLAQEVSGKGTTRLQLTGAGEWLAKEIKAGQRERKRA